MNPMQLTYVADPMCSWCWGFSSQPLTALLADGEHTLTLLMGGLRPYTTEPLGEAKAREILGHWHRVAEASGAPFAPEPHAAMQAAGFVYDTEPASRAVVVAREHWPDRAWALMKAVQRAFYADARDVTQAEVLADIGAECGIDRDAFVAAFDASDARAATARDFEQSQAWGIRGFPALIAEHGGRLHLIANGYTPVEALRERLQQLAAR
jgi:putative protein-disulfide isomerase